MAAKLEWDEKVPSLMIQDGRGYREVACVRTRAAGFEYDFVTYIGRTAVSEPYESEADARQDCYNEARRLLKEAGVTLAD